MHLFARHSLSIVSAGILLVWIVCYVEWDAATRWGQFFGNAIADWTGLVVTVIATKHLYERGSRRGAGEGWRELLRSHPLTLFLLVTGTGWLVVYLKMDADGKWGQVVGNLVSEWTQNLGYVLLTKKFIEAKGREHHAATTHGQVTIDGHRGMGLGR
jgi:hypothetical protein